LKYYSGALIGKKHRQEERREKRREKRRKEEYGRTKAYINTRREYKYVLSLDTAIWVLRLSIRINQSEKPG